jgi:translation initiation factor IF-2
MELQAPRDVPATGVVVEAQLSKGLGAVATVILKRGILKPGDPLVVGTEHGRVRVLRSGSGKTLMAAGPGQAVVVSGLKGLPAAGDELLVVEDEGRAARMAAARAARAEDFKLGQLYRLQAEARRQQQAARAQEYERWAFGEGSGGLGGGGVVLCNRSRRRGVRSVCASGWAGVIGGCQGWLGLKISSLAV